MQNKTIFIASSAELADDRQAFETFLRRKNDHWKDQGVYLQPILWEDFLDCMSQTRLQDEYNRAIRECDIFVMLFFTKVGRYTAEEFETAFKQFQANNKPIIYTYFKDASINTGDLNEDDALSLFAFKKKLKELGHYLTPYQNTDALQLHFSQQLDKLLANGFIDLNSEEKTMSNNSYQATLNGDGAIAQGAGATALGAGAKLVQGNNVETGGGAYVGGNVTVTNGNFTGRDSYHTPAPELDKLFEPLFTLIQQHAAPAEQAVLQQQAQDLQQEASKGKQADDRKMAGFIDGIVAKIPAALGIVAGIFASSSLEGIAGAATQYVLEKLQGK